MRGTAIVGMIVGFMLWTDSVHAATNCGSTFISRYRYTFDIAYGSITCPEARYPLAYTHGAFSDEHIGKDPLGWLCFDTRGPRLIQYAQVTHCYRNPATPDALVRLYDPRRPTVKPPWIYCGSYENVSFIRALRTTCYYARSVARRWSNRLSGGGHRRVASFPPFRCVTRSYLRGLAATVTCTGPRNSQIRFGWGD
jgi:hypothetical protein